MMIPIFDGTTHIGFLGQPGDHDLNLEGTYEMYQFPYNAQGDGQFVLCSDVDAMQEGIQAVIGLACWIERLGGE